MDRSQERAFLRRLKARDEGAFTELVRLYQGRVFNVVLRMLGSRAEAEDVAQEVFVSVFRHIDSFRGDSSLSTWLYRVATNHCKNRLKYHQRRFAGRTGPLDGVPEGALQAGTATAPRVQPPDKVLQGYEVQEAIRRGIAQLEEDHRVLIVLRDIQGLSYQQITEVTGLPIGTVKSRLHRARMALKEFIAPWLS